MTHYWRMFKFGLARTLKPSFYIDYGARKRELSRTDPMVVSGHHLAEMLHFCEHHNPYYASLSVTATELHQWPVLTKDILREKFAELQSQNARFRYYENSSGGSSGRPVKLIQDHSYRRWSARTQEYYFRVFLDVEWNHVPNLWLWGSDRDMARLRTWKTRGGLFLRNRMMLNTFQVSDQRWLEYADRIRSYKPYFVAGYAGSLYQLARVARKYNVRLYQPRFVYSSAELLQKFMRSEIEEQFRARVYDYYGSREVGAIAGECTKGKLHVFSMNNVVEVLKRTGRSAKAHEGGDIVITNLHNFAMPLIRYRIGDTGSLGNESCHCGSTLPVLESLSGRVTDHFRVRDGGLVHGEFFTHLFYFRDWVDRFQVVQVDFDLVRVLVVPATAPDAGDVSEITGGIRAVMGDDCSVEWRYVECIPQTTQGKHIYTRCLIDRC